VRLLPQCAAAGRCSLERQVCGGHRGFVLLLSRVAATREGLLSAELWNAACRKRGRPLITSTTENFAGMNGPQALLNKLHRMLALTSHTAFNFCVYVEYQNEELALWGGKRLLHYAIGGCNGPGPAVLHELMLRRSQPW
jgi:hypothetical protein